MTLACNVKTGWNSFIEFVQTRCSKVEFQNWLAPIRMVEESPASVVLEVPNIFVQEYLLEHFKSILCDFLPTAVTGELALSFVFAQAPKQPVFAAPVVQTKAEAPGPRLNELYTFENFIEGPSNQFIKSASMGVAMRPGKSYNPLFIHGGVGLGKTHLLHSIGHSIGQNHKKLKMQSITTEAFINDIVDNLRNRSIDQMKRHYRNLDVLLMDDIQFLQNRQNFEEEFCNTFEALIHQNKQVVITSDKPPSQLKLSERMVARMEWGLVAHVGIPDLETRVAIIKHKSERRGLNISSQSAFFIAEHIYNNVRQLEGAVNRLYAHSRLASAPLDQVLVEQILAEMLRASAPVKKVVVEEIFKSVATAFEVRVSDMKGESRQKQIMMARQVAMYLAKELIDESLAKLAASFGGKTHSTLLHAWKKVSQQMQGDPTLTQQVQMIRRNVTLA